MKLLVVCCLIYNIFIHIDIHYGNWMPGAKQFREHTVRSLKYKVKTDNMFIPQGYVSTESQQVRLTDCFSVNPIPRVFSVLPGILTAI